MTRLDSWFTVRFWIFMIEFFVSKNFSWQDKNIKITHMWRKLVTPQNFCLTFTDELEKQLLKKLLKWAYKNIAISTFTMLYFFWKNKDKNPGDITILHLWTKNPDDMIYSSWDIECDRMKLVIMENLLPFYPLPPRPKNLKNQNFKKCK